ncbi:2-(1,2-epoxy-1,2-dihydrophenyl)acetyl-CoA isomerase [Roseateles sp. YR242]|uniref:enoyl-CoA hydratase-related protein n=1 Tax=Roseateles sp. YR242 TaxID=1855305 RepID=UPI0008B90CE5|nr:enoyl-CoA hydratase-related protein [Roseateles sp. YR242]SEL22809.1 2-(1,2-epoxy-1,2-dihydrophenyl)acetyl-CoA isomerase [Roseateles sp. YR242]
MINTKPGDAAQSRLERHGEVALLRMVNSARMNPLTDQLQRELLAHLDAVATDTSLRALVLTGEGRAFCVGADLASMARVPANGRTLGQETGELMRKGTNPLVLALRRLPVPVVVALNGAAAGAGVGLALAGDLTIASMDAYFLMPFLPRLGIVPDMGSSWFLERRVGRARAMGLALLGDRLDGPTAAAWGLIWACDAADGAALDSQALALATRLAQAPAHAVQEARALFDAAASQALPEQLAYEADRQELLIDREAFREGATAFVERREPRFPRRA